MKNTLLLFFVILGSLYGCVKDVQTFRFGTGKAPGNAVMISTPLRYQSTSGYGFDFENWDRVTIEPLEKQGYGFCTSDAPFYFSILEDNTHFNAFGAHEIACCVLQVIVDLDLPLKEHIVHFEGKYDPSEPSDPDKWTLPESPGYISKKPEGD